MGELERIRVKQAQARRKPWLSGWCNPTNPLASHQRCMHHPRPDGVRCTCTRPGCPCNPSPPQGEATPPESPARADEVEPLPRPAGLYDAVDEEAYHRDPALSFSGAKLLIPPSTPAHFRWRMDHRPRSTRVFDLGHAVHALVLGVGGEIVVVQKTDRKTGEVSDADGYATESAKAHRDELHAAGKIPLLRKEHDQAQAMAAKIRRHPVAGRIFDPGRGKAEQSLWWEDDETGVRRRSRIDWLTMPTIGRAIVVDLKTTVNANPATFGKSAADFGYFMQHPYYLDGVHACGLADDAAFVFVLVEKDEPHLVSVVELDAEAVDLGRRLNARALATFADCTRTNTWPGYSEAVEPVSLPGWFTYRHEIEMSHA